MCDELRQIARDYMSLGNEFICNNLELALLKRQSIEDEVELHQQYQDALRRQQRLRVVLELSAPISTTDVDSSAQIINMQAMLLWVESSRLCELVKFKLEKSIEAKTGILNIICPHTDPLKE